MAKSGPKTRENNQKWCDGVKKGEKITTTKCHLFKTPSPFNLSATKYGMNVFTNDNTKTNKSTVGLFCLAWALFPENVFIVELLFW